MGELKAEKALYCLICDTEVHINESYSIFYTFITNSGVLLANSLEKNLYLKDISSVPLRSNLLCIKCFGYFEQLSICESKIIQLKGDLWTVYKATCQKHGESAEVDIKGVSTQTDFLGIECDCEAQNGLDFKFEKSKTDRENHLSKINQDESDQIQVKSEKPEEQTTVEAVVDDSGNQGSKKSEVSELESLKTTHLEARRRRTDKDKVSPAVRKKFHSCSVCNKKFRRPCEVKEHMVSHKSSAPFVCKYCGKLLKSKTGAIYHILKTHSIDIGDNKCLDGHFHFQSIESEYSKSNQKSEESDEKNVKKNSKEEESSSSEDELPLARRRKEFIYEKTKNIINIESIKPADSSVKKLKTVHKQGSQAIKKSDSSGVKMPRNSENIITGKDIVEDNLTGIEDELSFPGEKTKGETTFETKISDISRTNANHDKTEMSNSDGIHTSTHADGVKINEKTKRKTRKYPLNSIIKVKRQKDSNLFPPLIKEPKFKCDICGKMWKTRGELNAHKITHSDARPYICEICGQAYKHKPALDVHVGMHRGIYHHQCPYCQKAFTQKGALQRHLPIHTGDLPYQCELCGKRFVHRTSFSIHTMAHTGIRNIRCKICNLGVLSKSHLRRHMRIHTGEKPYDCQTCGKAFAERYNLVAHQRIHDPNLLGPARQQKKKAQSCRLCNATFDKRHKLEDHMVSIHNKVVEEVPRTSIFAFGEGYAAPRLTTERFEETKRQERIDDTVEEDKSVLIGNVENGSVGGGAAIDIRGNGSVETLGNGLSVRNIQNMQNLRNLELLRNLENNRNFELVRMTNGIGGIDESLRDGGGPGMSWTFVNPGS